MDPLSFLGGLFLYISPSPLLCPTNYSHLSLPEHCLSLQFSNTSLLCLGFCTMVWKLPLGRKLGWLYDSPPLFSLCPYGSVLPVRTVLDWCPKILISYILTTFVVVYGGRVCWAGSRNLSLGVFKATLPHGELGYKEKHLSSNSGMVYNWRKSWLTVALLSYWER